MKKKSEYIKHNATQIIQKIIEKLGGNYSVKFAVTDDYEQRVIIREWPTDEERLNVAIYRKVKDPFDMNEVNKRILQTLQKL